MPVHLLMGDIAGDAITIGSRISAFGYSAGGSIVSDTDLSAFGYRALESTTVGTNSAFGSDAMRNLTTGANNTGVGYQVANNASFNGSQNTIMGASTASSLTTGSNNTFLGANITISAGARSGCVALGTGASCTADDLFIVRLGNNASKQMVFTPVADATARSTLVTYLPFALNGVQYYIQLYQT